MTLMLTDLNSVLVDSRHGGWGYAGKKRLPSGLQHTLDMAVVDAANGLSLNREALFQWTDSKYGRWLVDHVEDDASSVNALVHQYLNEDAMRRLAQEDELTTQKVITLEIMAFDEHEAEGLGYAIDEMVEREEWVILNRSVREATPNEAIWFRQEEARITGGRPTR